MVTAVLKIIFIALFNLAAALALAPLLDGFMRRIKAVVHSRQGPPLLQTYYDLFKLFSKEDREVTSDLVFRLTPVVCLGAVLLAALFTPMGGPAPLGFGGDLILLVYLLSIPGIAIMLGAMSSGSPYAMLGASREMMLVLTVEPVLFITLFTAGIKANSLVLADITGWSVSHGWSISLVIAGLALLLALQSELAKLPFDLAEAETEIMEGPFVEYSGPKLALFKWAIYAKVVIYVSLFLEVFLPGPKTGILVADLLINLVKVFIVVGLVELIELVNPRLKIDQAINYFKGVAVLALIGLAFALMGM
ncbi:Formate hydrogenlyase subunit 4 [Pelotomaculum schinkii]|uniref:Formate hydrogenlyase subunit 4 n=1 Tax=Pelotomaculum schinkii TaxID=78350 RepID=A0A4Y7RGF9_9FIRM|nr:Formate hydrogenlyase subunit 4 [Pelotomaculum schinkii]TEB15788.1 Formate hydrogenlyase subunit 4 [Pelotomaculum sp. FP]